MGLRQVPKPTPERETERILKPEPGIRSGTNGKPDSTKTRQEAETANPVPSRIEIVFPILEGPEITASVSGSTSESVSDAMSVPFRVRA